MAILTYRGPSRSGGVSGSITQVFNKFGQGEQWWHITECALLVRQSHSVRLRCQISKSIVDGHYRYCNNFLWPVLHDMPEQASFSRDDHKCYQQFNLALAANVMHEAALSIPQSHYFVQDYQLALLPAILSTTFREKTSIFWHVPWPKSVRKEDLPMLSEVALGVLEANQVGFHITEYADNFMLFVQRYLPDYLVNFKQNTISALRSRQYRQQTKVIAQPLGLDLQFWKAQLEINEQHSIHLPQIPSNYVLSVDRADYTKGVIERLNAISEFFSLYPDWQTKVSFVQVCQRTRPGLASFDRYWDKCTQLASEINAKWRQENWEPIVWISEPLSSDTLASLYNKAQIMLVNPLRDGLNLTAKEFVACSGRSPGVLILSDGAGVWQELGPHALRAAPDQPRQLAAAILAGLNTPLANRQSLQSDMRKVLLTNSLAAWWQRFRISDRSSRTVSTGIVESNRHFEERAFQFMN